MGVPTVRVLKPIFGEPLLRAEGDAIVKWSKVNALSQWQKGTGWQISLTGGTQDSVSWAAAFIPTNGQLRVTDFNNALWSYYMTASQTMGVNIVIWVHNPDDFSDRAEITQLGNTALLGKASGWNSHKLLKTTTQFIYYGENIPSDTGLTSGTQYTWAEFQADPVFKNFLIYRVSFEYGWEASGTFQEVWLVEVTLNGTPVPLIPTEQEIEDAIEGQWLAATIVATNTTSAEVDLGGNFSHIEINIPTLISCTLKVTVSETPGGTFLDLGDGITSPTGIHNYNDTWKIGGWRYIKIVSSVTQSSTNRLIRVRGVNL